MKVQIAAIAAAIDSLIATTDVPDVNGGVRSIIGLCERDVPHPDWAALRAIDYTADATMLRSWFDRVLATDPPKKPFRGLYFSACQPVRESGQVTADLELVGTAAYEPADPDLDWLFTRHYFPDAYARSDALDRIYELSYHTHDVGVEIEGVLGNEAEWPVGLAYTVLAARAILEGRTTAELPTDLARVGVAAGWGEGDMLLIGEVTESGFVPTTMRAG